MLSCLLKFYIFSSHNALQLCFVKSNFIFKIVLLRYNRHTKNCTYVTCTIWWVWSYANIHDTFTLCFWFLFQNWFEYSLYFPSCLLFSLHFMPSFHSMFSFVILFFLPKIFLYCDFWYWFTVTNSLFLSGNLLILPLFLQNTFNGCNFQDWQLFFLRTLKVSLYILIANCFCWADSWFFCYFEIKIFFFSAIFKSVNWNITCVKKSAYNSGCF